MMQRLFNADQRELLYVKARGLCTICKARLDSSFHADHIIPWSRGGKTTISNGQALCQKCNLSKGRRAMLNSERYLHIANRDWQQEAMSKIFRDVSTGNVNTHLIVACPGAGKTRLAIAVASAFMDADIVDYVVVVSPKDVIRSNWTNEAHKLASLNIVPISSRKMRQQQINSLMTYQGFSTTYQSNAKGYGAINQICSHRKVLVILDEVHWARAETKHSKQAFGAALVDAFGGAAQILSLSGTPWRSDRAQIPFVRYENNVVVPTHTYTYSRAIDHGVCRPIVFHRMDGLIEFEDSDYGHMRGYLGAETEARRTDENEYFCIQDHIGRKYLKAATDPDINLCIKLIEKANNKLQDIRKEHKAAGGLIICRGIEEADALADQMVDNLGIEPVVVHSNSGSARQEIEAFARSEAPWILSVGMVTEGTDIPRLRVGVHLHTTMTLMHFVQFCGRMVRWQSDLDDEHQVAHIFIPQYGPLHLMAQDIEAEVAMSVFEGEGEKKPKEPCKTCGKRPCECECIVCGMPKTECECIDEGDEEYFRAINSEDEEGVGSTSRGDDYTEEEQRTADDFSKDEVLRSRYSEVQLLAFAKLINDKDMMREWMNHLSDEEFNEFWSRVNEKKNRA